MKKFLGLFAGVAILLCSSVVQAEPQTYRVMSGSSIEMDLGGGFHDVDVNFVEGALLSVDVTTAGSLPVVRRIEINEIIIAEFGITKLIQDPSTIATVTFVNNVGGYLALTGSGVGELDPNKINKIKKEGFYYQYNVPGQGYTPGVTRQHPRASLYQSGPTYWLPAQDHTYPSSQSAELPPGAAMINAQGGFMKMANRPGEQGFGGPMQLKGGALALGLTIKLDIFGRDQTRTSVGQLHQQAMSWGNGTAKARFGGDYRSVFYGVTFLGQKTALTYSSRYPNGNTSLPGSKNGIPHYGEKYTSLGALNTKATLPTHTGFGPYYYANGYSAAPTWAKPVASGGASRTTMGGSLAIKKLGIVSEFRNHYTKTTSTPGTYPIENLNLTFSGLTTQHQTPDLGFSTIIATQTTYSAKTIFPEVVTISLVSPAIMNVGTGMGIVGIVNLNLQRVPEPGPIILMAVSALCLAGVSVARGRKS